MTRTSAAFLAILLFSFAVCWAAENPVVGKWDCRSNDGSGQDLTWTLLVKQDGGKLSGSLAGGPERPGEMPLIDPKLEGDTFTFKILVNDACTVQATLKVDGKKLDGKFGCAEVNGTLKGVKQS